MAWCFSTRASVATVLTTHPCFSQCLRVNQIMAWLGILIGPNFDPQSEFQWSISQLRLEISIPITSALMSMNMHLFLASKVMNAWVYFLSWSRIPELSATAVLFNWAAWSAVVQLWNCSSPCAHQVCLIPPYPPGKCLSFSAKCTILTKKNG